MLRIELVPRSAWWQNVRSHVSRKDWEKCKQYARAKTADGSCIICGSSGYEQGRNYPSEAHEIWGYDDETSTQTLVDIIPLCPLCHQCKHLGHTRQHASPDHWATVIEHLQSVNRWTDEQTLSAVELAFAIWDLRSQVPRWHLDIGFLKTIGIERTMPLTR